MVSVEDLVRHEEQHFNQHVINSRETVMQAVDERVKIKEVDKGESHVDKWTRKVMHG